jgi:organic hydroperoxide reductase OsmC/OhrA
MPDREHRYGIETRWTGNLGSGTSAYAAYSRNHELSAPEKAATIPGSSDPAFRGDRTRYNPEELLLGALSACHMLWVLHLCADAGIVVTGYIDSAEGVMAEHADGSGEFTRVVLKPRVTLADGSRAEEAFEIHHKAHAVCALARSMRFEVVCQPEIRVSIE